MFLEIIIALFAGFLTVWFYFYIMAYWKLKTIPAPPVWPIIGNALDLKDPEKCMYELPRLLKQLKSDTIRLHLGFYTVLVTMDYKFIELVLSSPTLTYKEYNHFFPWLGQGIFTATGEKWKKSRKMLTPTFHFKILEQFLDVFNSNASILASKFNKYVDDLSVDVFPLMTLCTLDIICETAMGISVNAQLDETSEYAESVHKETNIVVKRGFAPLFKYDWIYNLSSLNKEEQALLKILHGHTDSVIKARKEKLRQEEEYRAAGKLTEKEDDFGRKKRIPFLDLLLQTTIDGRLLTDKELRDEVSTIMFGGHDTTAGAMSFTLFALANYPEVQRKAFEEILNIFGDDKDRACTTTDINNLKYLEMVLKESLRMYPSAPIIGRTLAEDVQYGDLTIPNGTEIWFLIYSIHRDPRFFSNPEKFDPGRFSAENYQDKKPFSFIPFSAGPRNCIGQKYAMMEMKCVISTILRHFLLRPATPEHIPELRSSIILKSFNGIKIAFTRRQ